MVATVRKPVEITYEAVERKRRPFPWMPVLAFLIYAASYASDAWRAHDCLEHSQRWIEGGACTPNQCVPK